MLQDKINQTYCCNTLGITRKNNGKVRSSRRILLEWTPFYFQSNTWKKNQYISRIMISKISLIF